MKEVAISEFKAKCLQMLKEVDQTKQPIRITKHGKPIAEVVPPTPQRDPNWLGYMEGTGKILGDIVSPIIDLDDFEVFRD